MLMSSSLFLSTFEREVFTITADLKNHEKLIVTERNSNFE